MTDPTLEADLQSAPEGSRELSDRVLLALGWKYEKGTDLWFAPNAYMSHSGARPDPTRSLDDAKGLSNWLLLHASEGPSGLPTVKLGDGQHEAEGHGYTLELAWSAAARKAHRAKESE